MPGSMHLFVTELRDFYETPLGTVARRLIRRQIRNIWPETGDRQIIGLGYATPYLLTFHQRTFVAALMPAHQGVTLWPPEGPYKAALIDESNLPLPDSSVERVLVVHALEMSDNGEDMMREIWRVLKPEGELLLIVPNRRGPWAGPESTPFGHGRPYSRTQLEKLLAETGFLPKEWHPALFMPPSHRALPIRFAIAFERLGARLWPAFAGVHIVLATKQVYSGLLNREQADIPARLVPVPSAISLRERHRETE